MITRELFAPAPELPPTPDSTGAVSEPGRGAIKSQPLPQFAAVIEDELRPRPTRPRPEPRSRRVVSEAASTSRRSEPKRTGALRRRSPESSSSAAADRTARVLRGGRPDSTQSLLDAEAGVESD